MGSRDGARAEDLPGAVRPASFPIRQGHLASPTLFPIARIQEEKLQFAGSPYSNQPLFHVAISRTLQCGKSTLSRHCEPGRHYVSLDDKAYLDLALADPQGFIGNLPEQVAIDEVQRAPELTLAIKRSVDANRKPGRFLLTGSANGEATFPLHQEADIHAVPLSKLWEL